MLEELARRLDPGGTLLRGWELEGGVSAHVTAFEVRRADGRVERLVLRRHGAGELARDPCIAEHEHRLLEIVRAAGVPAPAPRLHGLEGLVIEYVDGEPAPSEPQAVVGPLAAVLADIHRVAAAGVSFLARRESAGRNADVLLHGDFWPGNTLWQDGTIVAVLDWEDAAIGDPLADVSNARLELLWAYGAQAADDFTRGYASLAHAVDLADLAAWDLAAHRRLAGRIGDWGLDAATAERLRALADAFAAEAAEQLSPRPGVRASPRSAAAPRRR